MDKENFTMKTLNIHFTDKEFNELSRAKRKMLNGDTGLSWHKFLLQTIRAHEKYLKTVERRG